MKSKAFEGVAALYNAVGMKHTSNFLREDLANRKSLFDGLGHEVKATGSMFQAMWQDVKSVGRLFKKNKTAADNKGIEAPHRDMEP